MAVKACLWLVVISWQSTALALSDVAKPVIPTMNAGTLLTWCGALVLVLAIFMFCAAMLRKFNGGIGQSGGKMRMVSGIALGMREKVVLLEVGKKQVLLAVTPGKIESLLVLEGEDCLVNNTSANSLDTGFAQKLMQAVKARSDATL